MYAYHLRPRGICVCRRWIKPFFSRYVPSQIEMARPSPPWQRSPKAPGLTNLPSRARCAIWSGVNTSRAEKENVTGRVNSLRPFTQSKAYRWMSEKLDSILWLVHGCINLQGKGSLRLVHGCIINHIHLSIFINKIRACLRHGAPGARSCSEGF